MVNISGLSQIKKKINKATIDGDGFIIIILENISKSVENMNIKFIHDITV